jgi:predicted enzyme related to lactoylglutathione lyase
MERVIPILPCPDIKEQVAFYKQLGFDVLGVYTSPNPYAAVQFAAAELHFYGTKKMTPGNNSSMCFIKVEDVDAIYQAFATAFKKNTGKIPRSGIPRISKVRDLVNDRRFTLTDPGGNTFYIGNQRQTGAEDFFRVLENSEWAKKFTVLYDLTYSKEDFSMAADMLPRFEAAKESLNDLDRAKLLLVTLEIQRQLGQAQDHHELKTLLDLREGASDNWRRLNEKYLTILRED